jgi:peptide/nickel transport system permease protein
MAPKMTDSTDQTASTAEADTADGHDTSDPYQSYPEIVWEQFQSYTMSYVALCGVGVLFLIALLAPVIAMNVPFYIHIPEAAATPNLAAGTHYPWFNALFDINFFESGVDIFFNYMLFTLPLNFVAWFIFKTVRSFEDKRHYKTVRMQFIVTSAILQTAGFIAVLYGGFRQPYVNYTKLADKEGVRALFPVFEYSYRDVNVMAATESPSWAHWLGTDRQGRDVFTRLIYGTRISLTIGIVAVSLYTAIGSVLGAIGGYFGGIVDTIVLRIIEVVITFPVLFLILTLRGFIEDANIFHVMLLIGVTRWTGIARLVRGEFLRLRNEDFVQAARALGLPEHRIIFRHVLPNALGPVLVAVTFGIAGAILIEATLSFLGLGPGTAPSWGQILITGRQTSQMPLILAGGTAIFITISLLNLAGEGLRDAIDPKLKN